MPEAGTTAPDVSAPAPNAPGGGESALAGQIDALLSNMGDSAATLAGDAQPRRKNSSRADASAGTESASLEGRAPAAPPTPLNSAEVESLSAQIEALVDEVAAARREPARPEPPRGETPTARDEDGGEIGAASAGATVAPDVAAAAGQPEPRPVPNAGSTSAGADLASSEAAVTAEAAPTTNAISDVDLRQLDAQLAARAESTVEPVAPVPAAPVASTLPAPDAGAAPSAAAAIAAQPEAASAPDAAANPGVTSPRDVGRQETGSGRGPLLARAAASVKPVAARVLALSARAMERSPKVARDTAGWIGLVTLFFACCMWAIVLFFRSTPVPETYGVPSGVLEPGEPTPQGRARPRAGHAEEPTRAEQSHGDNHAAPEDHGGGH